MPRIVLTLIFLIVVFARPAVGADFNKGWDAFNKKDYASALREWKPLAEQGNATAQFNLGVMYGDGRVVVQDYTEAVKWFRKAAEQGYSRAQYNLGLMYNSGRGVVQDYKEAAKWYRKAAKQGHVPAQYSLGFMYGKGQGVLQDYFLAHMWFNIAASMGNKMANKSRDFIEKKMTPADVSKAQKMARECVKKSYKGCGQAARTPNK